MEHTDELIAEEKVSLRRLRLQIGYSIAEMAEDLNLKKATYQCYEDGSRRAPDDIEQKMRATLVMDKAFMDGLPARIDEAELKKASRASRSNTAPQRSEI